MLSKIARLRKVARLGGVLSLRASILKGDSIADAAVEGRAERVARLSRQAKVFRT